MINVFLTSDMPRLESLDDRKELVTHWSRPYEYAFANFYIDPDDVVLDACCGYVYGFTHYLARRCKKVVGVDLTPEIMELPELPNLSFVKSDIRTYRGEELFDKIFCISALEHMGCEGNIGKCNTYVAFEALQNMHKLLKNGGKVILTVDHPLDSTSLCGLDAYTFRDMAYQAGFIFEGGCPDYDVPENVLYSGSTWNIFSYTAVLVKHDIMPNKPKYKERPEVVLPKLIPMKWSLCLIVKNEAERIQACLDSTKDLFEEFCVTDTGSTDDTVSILKTYQMDKMKISHFTWIDDFAAARNFSFSKATGDFIMWLDADDVLPEESYQTLKRLKADMADGKIQGDGYMFRYLYGCLDFFRLRLVRRSMNYRWYEPIHEYIQHQGSIITIPQIVVQHTRVHSNGDRNLKILEKNRFSCTARAKYYYGRELIEHKRFVEAYKVLTKVVQNWDGWSEDLLNACNLLGHLLQDIPGLMKQVKETDVCRVVRQAFKHDIRPESLYIIATEKLKAKQYVEAIRFFKLCIATPTEVGTVTGFIDKRYETFFPALQLTVCYFELKNMKEALAWHNKCLELEPEHPSVLQNEEFFKKHRKS